MMFSLMVCLWCALLNIVTYYFPVLYRRSFCSPHDFLRADLEALNAVLFCTCGRKPTKYTEERKTRTKKKTRSLNVDKMTITIAKAMNPTCPKRNRVKHKLI